MKQTLNAASSEAADEAAGQPTPAPELFLAPCFTSAAFEAERDSSRLPLFIPPNQSWLAPLLDAIGSPVFPDSTRTVALWLTQWGYDKQEENPPEHGAYVAYSKQFSAQRMPWLIPLLDAARAIVVVCPGTFAFGVDNYIGAAFDIPELVPYTHLTPWATDDERKRAN